MKSSNYLCLLFLLALSLSNCKQPSVPSPNDTMPTRNDNMAMGNPDGAKAFESIPNAYLIIRPTYSLSYNNSTGIANWCSSGLGKIGVALRWYLHS